MDEGVAVELGGTQLMKLWHYSAPYMGRILAILKHSDVRLNLTLHQWAAPFLHILAQVTVT